MERVTNTCGLALALLVLAGCQAAPRPPVPLPHLNADTKHVEGDPVDDAVREWMAARHIPGVVLAVVRDGRVVKVQAYGLADVRRRVPVRPDTAFRIYSLSKCFLAVAVSMLADEGKVDLDAPVGRYLAGAPKAWRGVTVRDLVAHTSGIPDFLSRPMVVPDFWPFGLPLFGHYLSADFDRDLTARWLLAFLGRQPLLFEPGTRFGYSNSDYVVLAEVVRRVTGERYDALLRGRIFGPLGMTRTRVWGDGPPLADTAVGYSWGSNPLHADWANDRLHEDPGIRLTLDGVGPASSGIVTTVGDLAKWDAALSAGKLLSPASLRRTWTPPRLKNGGTSPWGLGWEIGGGGGAGPAWVGHGGSSGGYTCSFVRYDDGATVMYLTNLGYLDLGTTPPLLWKTFAPHGEP